MPTLTASSRNRLAKIIVEKFNTTIHAREQALQRARKSTVERLQRNHPYRKARAAFKKKLDKFNLVWGVELKLESARWNSPMEPELDEKEIDAALPKVKDLAHNEHDLRMAVETAEDTDTVVALVDELDAEIAAFEKIAT